MKIKALHLGSKSLLTMVAASGLLLISGGCESVSKGTKAVGDTVTGVAMTPMHTLEYNKLRMKEAELKQELVDLQAEHKALETEKAKLSQTSS